jgi:hypothetical protein
VTSTQKNAIGVIASVQRDHREIKQMIGNVASREGNARRVAFEDLVRKLAVHETAEEDVVHPLGKKAGLDDTVDELLEEESKAKKALAKPAEELQRRASLFETAAGSSGQAPSGSNE